ncbi:hypothetical protein SRB5_14930 [Streptomyces sp. RB5]|uniref:Antitoxin n=1 Tax=Streptomyces smaragdinus TaxID=2585196 RepID=A0A7K0CD29_9ACTN|nr:type II toxin-antitoxin system Phd/YefM family antitoxin [Streptomyces smaragdinus]MQY11377.1 hypothetical protein [Streptomyces smaragdinus]
MDSYALTEAQSRLGTLARLVATERKQIALTDQGQVTAILISPAELEDLEDYRIAAEYQARKERGETGPGIPMAEARRRLFGDDE